VAIEHLVLISRQVVWFHLNTNKHQGRVTYTINQSKKKESDTNISQSQARSTCNKQTNQEKIVDQVLNDDHVMERLNKGFK
jgi:hypothetical protein